MKNYENLQLKQSSPLIAISLLYLLLLFFLKDWIAYWQYMFGYSCAARYYAGLLFWSPMLIILINIVFLIFYLIVAIVLCRRRGKATLVPAALYLVLTVLLLSYSMPAGGQTSYMLRVNGFYYRVTEHVSIDEISVWLKSQDFPESKTDFFLPEDKWPKAITVLKPKEVHLAKIDNVNVVSLFYGGALSGYWGATVMEEHVNIPFDRFYRDEYRVQICNRSFVWAELARNKFER